MSNTCKCINDVNEVSLVIKEESNDKLLKSKNIFRKVVIDLDGRWVSVVELSRIGDNSFQKYKYMTYGNNSHKFGESKIVLDNKFLDKELKELDSKVRHYGKRVMENYNG